MRKYIVINEFIFHYLLIVLMLIYSTQAYASVKSDHNKIDILKRIHAAGIPFIENNGQLGPKSSGVKYYIKTFGGNVYISNMGRITYYLPKKSNSAETRLWAFSESMIGSKAISVQGEEKPVTNVNYFKGSNPKRWEKKIGTYNYLNFHDIYDGIGLKIRAHDNNVEKLYSVRPLANAKDIRIRIDGASGLTLDKSGKLKVTTGLGEVEFTKPVAYQEIDGKREYVDVSYIIKGNEYGFRVGNYDRSKELVIDPLLATSFIGGSGYDTAKSLAIDSSGNIYIAGKTFSSDMDTPVGACFTIRHGASDVFIAKFDSNLQNLLAATYLGGSGDEDAAALAIDASGSVYVAGDTNSADFPTTTGSYSGTLIGTQNIFVTRLNENLGQIISSTLLGGSGSDHVAALSLDKNGNLCIAGDTLSTNFPTTSGAFATVNQGSSDIFVAMLDPGLANLLASTLLGGFAEDEAKAMVLDKSGNVFVAGKTASANFPTTPDAFSTANHGVSDAFVVKLDANLHNILSSTLIGGSSADEATAILVDGSGSLLVAGNTASSDFPVANGGYSSLLRGSSNTFVIKLDSSLSVLSAGTFLGGSSTDEVASLALDDNNNVYVAGKTSSTDFPVTAGAYSTANLGGFDAFIAKFDSTLSHLTASSFLGGTGDDEATAIVSHDGLIFLTGTTSSADFPSLNAASWPKGGSDGFAAIMDANLADNSGDGTTSSQNGGSNSSADTTGNSSASGTGTGGQPAGSGWTITNFASVSPAEADAYYASRAGIQPNSGLITPLAATTTSPEITELARALRYDPKLIYDYVHNNIDYVPYFGSLKGATLTYLDGSGNDFDQASLMIALLRASGYSAQYVYGTMTIPLANLANWLGVDPIADLIQNKVLANGGIPATGSTLSRVWVKATIGNGVYLFDPSFKTYSYTPKIDVGNAMGYSQYNLLAAASVGMTWGEPTYVQNVNESNIINNLVGYSNNLVNTIRTTYPNKDVGDIIGGRSIIQSSTTQYATTLPFPTSVSATWDDIPTQYITTLRIQHAGIDYTFNTPDLSGKRLTLTYAGSDNHPELRQDGTLIVSGSATTKNTRYDLTFTVDHHFPNGNGKETTTPAHSLVSGCSYAIAYGFGGLSDSLLQKRQQQLNSYLAQGLSNSSEAVLGETLNIMGATWLKELMLANRILAAHSDTVVSTLHSVGLVAQEGGYYIDVKTYTSSVASKHNIDSDALVWLKSNAIVLSAFEHGVLEQLMGIDKPAASTVKLLQVANSAGRSIFLVNSANFYIVKYLLLYPPVNPGESSSNYHYSANAYSPADVGYFQSEVNSGKVLITPDLGQLTLNQWKGKGYISSQISGNAGSVSMIIGGNYFGGYSSYQGLVDPPTVSWNTWTPQLSAPTFDTVNFNFTLTPPSFSRDPVDMAGGAFLVDHTDLSLGSPSPLGLAFSRSYTSGDSFVKNTFGYGWNHGYDIRLTATSHVEPAVGMRQPIDAASFIAGTYAIVDLFRAQSAQGSDHNTLVAWVTSALIGKWTIGQVTDNAITLNTGKKLMEFIRLADGTYASPPGITAKLVKNGDGTYSLQERFGTRTDFDASKRVIKWTDVDGNAMIFTYDGDNLKTIRDAFGRTLTLSYDSGRISMVTDSTGRSVSYGYSAAGDLTSYTDAEGKVWSYGYDANHRLTTLTNPLNIITATNAYDSLGRMTSQTVPRQGGTPATYNYYFSGYRNVEEGPSGYTTTYFYDRKGREYAKENGLGQRTGKIFDGQDQAIQITDPLGNIKTFLYDGNHNMTQVTDALNHVTKYTYDLQFRLTDTTDPLFHTNHIDYDAKHHPTSARDGVGNYTLATYYANGLKLTSTDGRSTQTVFTHDVYGNPYASTTSTHPPIFYGYDTVGRMTSLTDQVGANTGFGYDKRSLLLTVKDPLNNYTINTYDAAGQLYTKTDRNGVTATNYYTPSGKVDRTIYSGGSSVVFTYNLLDQITAMQDGIGTSRYGYDAAGRTTSATNPYGFVTTYAYDAAGNLTQLTYPGNKTVTYGYDALNRLKTVTNWLNQTATYDYDDAGRLTGLTNFNGAVTTYGYDEADRLISISSQVADYSFTLDGNGNRTGVTQTEPFSAIVLPPASSYGYNAAKNRLLSAGNNGFGYDNEGQLSSGYGRSYTFDPQHRLTAISGVGQYSYDGGDNRLQAVRNGVTIRYVYDKDGALLAEADGNNTITRYYIHGAGLMAMVTPASGVYCYHYNGTGSTVAVTDQNQVVVNKYAYDPFGNIAAQEESIAQPFKFVGQYGVMAEPNGFYYMKARYYDPNVRRFISEDPKGFDGGDVNLMAYVGNNPIMGVDPSGLINLELLSEGFRNLTAGGVLTVGGALLAGSSGGVGAAVGVGSAIYGAEMASRGVVQMATGLLQSNPVSVPNPSLTYNAAYALTKSHQSADFAYNTSSLLLGASAAGVTPSMSSLEAVYNAFDTTMTLHDTFKSFK